MPKDRMTATLGESQLLVPGLITGGRAANDRVKCLLTLIQGACAAVDGVGDQSTLRDDRVACGVEDSRLDRVVAESVREPEGRYRVPGAHRLARWAIDEVHTMLEAVAHLGIELERETDEAQRPPSARRRSRTRC
jgi:hypothetical protein